MEYKQLVFVAPRWKEELDEKTGTLYLRAMASDSTLDCELLMDPIPGTDPVQYRYRCRSIGCANQCKLKTVLSHGGIIYYCECTEGVAHGVTTRGNATVKARKGPKKKVKRAK